MHLPPGYETTQRAIEALRAARAMIVEFGAAPIFCEERSTLKAMGVLRSRGRNLAEVKRRLEELPRVVMMIHEEVVRPWPLDAFEAIPDEAIVLCNRQRSAYCWIECGQIAGRLGIFSRHPARVAWVQWFCGQFAQAVFRHRYYNPTTNHEPPPSKLLDATERHEVGRDLLNQWVPGLGDWLASQRT